MKAKNWTTSNSAWWAAGNHSTFERRKWSIQKENNRTSKRIRKLQKVRNPLYHFYFLKLLEQIFLSVLRSSRRPNSGSNQCRPLSEMIPRRVISPSLPSSTSTQPAEYEHICKGVIRSLKEKFIDYTGCTLKLRAVKLLFVIFGRLSYTFLWEKICNLSVQPVYILY